MNHDEEKLPEVREGVLNADGLAALLRDIGTLAKVDEVIVKGGTGGRNVSAEQPSAPLSLEEVERLLLAREVRGVQIRYRHGGAIWWDTLMCAPEGGEGVRLVRIRHEIQS
jgi:hypothetical protein